MESRNTIFVIGAGASADVGFPVGRVLRDKIARLLKFNFSDDAKPEQYYMLDAMQQCVSAYSDQKVSEQALQSAANFITKNIQKTNSIDDFVNAHKGNAAIEITAKLAIVHEILNAERQSILNVDRHGGEFNYEAIDDSWYMRLLRILNTGDINELEKRLQHISFVIFNYDRCVEHFLYYSIKDFHNLNHQDAVKLVSTASFYHPYGAVGTFRFSDDDVDIVNFGKMPTPDTLVSSSAYIKTYSESTGSSLDNISKMHDDIKKAERIIFLGFAYHELNMSLLNLNEFKPGLSIIGTASGLSAVDAGDITKEMLETIALSRRENIRIDISCKCHELFMKYGKRLSFG